MTTLSVFVHSTGAGPSMWASVPDGALGGATKLSPPNLGYPPRAPFPRGEVLAKGADTQLLLEAIGDADVHLHGHSYGAAVALDAARHLGPRVRSMFLFEPVMFGALVRENEVDPAALAEAHAFTADRSFLDDDALGGTEPWLERFIDYWNRPGSWARMPDPMKDATRAVSWKMYQEVRSCFYDVSDFDERPLPSVPCTLVTAERSTAAARAMVRSIARRNPHARVVELMGTGHMAPLTHAAKVSEAVAEHARMVSCGLR